MKLIGLATALSLALSGPSWAATADLDQTLADLLTQLPGIYDSEAHKLEDEAKGLPKELVHGWVNRSFTVVDAPDVGKHVVVMTVRYNGADGMWDNGEFQTWTVTVDEPRGMVRMDPHRFKDPEHYKPIARDADAMAGMTKDELLPPEGAAGCPIYWTKEDGTLQGATDPKTCVNMSSTMGIPLGWEWSYVLGDDALWLNYAGYNKAGEIVNGRADQLPYRLDRVNP